MSEHESDAEELDRDPWEERDQFLAEHEGEDIQTGVHLVVPEDEGEDPLA